MSIDWDKADALCKQLTPDEKLFARHTISQLAEKWTLWTMASLDASDAPLRFSRVMEEVPGVSQKSLIKTLRQLEHDGLVTRSVFAEIPPRVEYVLTDLGREMLSQIYPLWHWTLTNIKRLAAAQRKLRGCVFSSVADGYLQTPFSEASQGAPLAPDHFQSCACRQRGIGGSGASLTGRRVRRGAEARL